MIEQTYRIDMIPDGAPVVVHVSQYDTAARRLSFELYNGGVAYELPAGAVASIAGTKPDNTSFLYAMTVSGNLVSIDLQQQMALVAGDVPAEIQITGAEGKIGSANFIIRVERGPIDENSVISETDLPIFEQLVSDAQTAADTASAAATSVSAILPASSGTPGQVLTKTATGADWTSLIMYKGFVSNSITLAQYATGSVAINVSVPGYTPLGVVGLTFSDTAVLTASRWAFNTARTTLNIDVVNNWKEPRSASIIVTVLYVKNA